MPRGSVSQRRRRHQLQFLAVIAIELFLIATALLAKPVLRAIPGRYRSRLPQPIQRLAEAPHSYMVPTPAAAATFALPTFPVTPPTAIATPAPPTSTPLVQPPTRPGSSELSSEATSTPELTSTPTPTPVLLPGQAARSTPADLKRALVLLTGAKHEYQLWNNCSPATLSMALSYYGWEGDQRQAAAFLKPNQEDKNVSLAEMADFVQQQGLEAVVRYGGDVPLIRNLLVAGFPVVVEKGFDPEPDELGWMGHFLLIVGYNEFERAFITMDSYLGPEQSEPYALLDDYWKHFNRTYLVIYRSEQEGELAAVLGDDMDPTVNLWNALAVAIAEVRANPQDAYAWFNLGTSYTSVGYYEDGAGSFDQARRLGLPWRMLWYQFGPFVAYYRVGRYDEVLALSENTLASSLETVEEPFYYRGLALQVNGDLAGARQAFQKAVDFNPNYLVAIQALAALAVVQ